MLDVTCSLVVANGSFKHCKNCKSLLYFFFFLHYVPCSINYNTLYTDKRHNNVIGIISPIIHEIRPSSMILINKIYTEYILKNSVNIKLCIKLSRTVQTFRIFIALSTTYCFYHEIMNKIFKKELILFCYLYYIG